MLGAIDHLYSSPTTRRTISQAKTPCTTRAVRSCGPLVVKPQAIEAMRNTALPANMARRRPKRSASAPDARRAPVKARLYASMTQAAPATAKPTSLAMAGMATTTAVTSNSVRNVPRPSASVIRFDRPCAIWDARLCMSSPLWQGLRVGQRSAARSTSMAASAVEMFHADSFVCASSADSVSRV